LFVFPPSQMPEPPFGTRHGDLDLLYELSSLVDKRKGGSRSLFISGAHFLTELIRNVFSLGWTEFGAKIIISGSDEFSS